MRPGLVILFLLLSACGQRGPLYLPDEPQQEAVMSTGDTSGETDSEEDWQDTPAPTGAERAEPEDSTDAGVLPETGDQNGASAGDENKNQKGRKDVVSPDAPGRQD